MTYPLAVSLCLIGERSETFLKRHVIDLLPGRTVAVGRVVDASDWCPPEPIVDPQRCENLNAVARRLAEIGVSVLMGEYLDESLPWIDPLRDTDIRFFAHAHGYDVSQRLEDPEYRVAYDRYRNAAGVITMSRHSRQRLVDLGLPHDRVHVIPYGVDVPPEPPARQIGVPVRCVAIGRMVPKKAPMLLLEAFALATQRLSVPLHLDYIGAGPLLNTAREFVASHNLHNVTLHGGLPNSVVLTRLRAADIFMQHSVRDSATGDEEGLPVAILEAMANALPVVSTRHAGIPEAVIEGEHGYLVDERDVSTMAEHVVALAREPEQRLTLGRNGWSHVQARYSWTAERSALLAVLGLTE